MPPAEQPEQAFVWERSLDSALSAFAGGDARVAVHALLGALDGCAAMADLCQQDIIRLSPGLIPPKMLQTWYDFLTKLRDSMRSTFTDNADVAAPDDSGKLERIFDDINESALAALMALKYMDAKGAPEEGRIRAVEKLEKLRTVLQAGRIEMGQISTGDETAEISSEIDPAEVAHVRAVGRIAAGQPIPAIEYQEDSPLLPRRLAGEDPLFLVRIDDDSMADVGILDGDFAVIRRQSSAKDGEVIAASLDNRVTVKTFKRSGDHVWLVAENPAHTDILADGAIILGKLVAILRRI